jgi:ATP-dependent DNA helicase RecG
MLDFYKKIKQVLSLEKDKGFQNSAVSGGLGKFISFIEKHGEQNNIHRDIITPLINYFESYATLSYKDREKSIDIILDCLSEDSKAGSKSNLQDVLSVLSTVKNKPDAFLRMQDPAIYADIRSIKGIGDKNYKCFEKLGIKNIYDLLRYYPRRYQDFSNLKTISSIEYGEELTVAGIIRGKIHTRKSKRGNLKISETSLSDSTGSLRLTWFNQPYIASQLMDGMSIVVSGKVDMYLGRFVMNNPEWEPLEREQIHTNRIVPIYPATSGITQRQIRNIIKKNLGFWTDKLKEFFPSQIIENENFPTVSKAISQIHFPESDNFLKSSQHRFAFEEIFFLQLGVLLQKENLRANLARKYSLPRELINDRINNLPYVLTSAQVNAMKDIENDLVAGRPMHRLLQGDVGSGKTIVAKFAIEIVIGNGSQAVFLAPTSILVEQHFNTLSELLINSGSISSDEIALLIGQTPNKEKENILRELKTGKIKCVIGTHALLEDPVEFCDLQLAVIDEQHRFGVNQRKTLRSKGNNLHLLVMTATPIPRSLALTVYGDLDVTTIDEMPPGRKPVKTLLFSQSQRKKAYGLIKEQIRNGFQAFIVYPMIDSNEEEEVYKSAVKEYHRIQKSVFPDFNIGLMHGRLKQSEKDRIMGKFRSHQFDVLISTTVIEVGVDIPGATIVLIESANYFGLAQLHQIRGRVGRNKENSLCILIPANDDALENERLIAMTQLNDGFKLAEIDLNFRGPGEFLGIRQSGYAGFKFANIFDIDLIEASRKQVQYIINHDSKLEHPEHELLREELFNYWPEIQK